MLGIAIDNEQHVPFEFVRQITSSSSMTKASDIKGGPWSRHCILGGKQDTVILGRQRF